MNQQQIKLIEKEFGISIDDKTAKIFKEYMSYFLQKNSLINLISKKDTEFLFEKHVFDSFAFTKVVKNITKKGELLDIGTGGGFPSIPISIVFKNINVYAVDSIKKKIAVLDDIKNEFNLQNFYPINDRVENIQKEFDFITARAVSDLSKLIEYIPKRLKKDGLFIAYKSKKVQEEIHNAKPILTKKSLKIIDIINYKLP